MLNVVEMYIYNHIHEIYLVYSIYTYFEVPTFIGGVVITDVVKVSVAPDSQQSFLKNTFFLIYTFFPQ